MRYNQTYNPEKTLLPPVAGYLASIPDSFHFGNLHPVPMRSPAGIFNIAYGEVLGAVEKLFDVLATAGNQGQRDRSALLTDSAERLFQHVCSFYDDAFLILIAISPPSANNPKFSYDWLKANGYHSADVLKSSTVGVIKPWREVFNRLKHHNQRLSTFTLDFPTWSVEGCFVEGVETDGAIAPDPTLHKGAVQGIPQAFSFKRLSLTGMLAAYQISDKLLVAVRHQMEAVHHFRIPKILASANKQARRVWDKLLKIDYYFFPDEFKLQYPRVRVQDGLYRLSYPHGESIYTARPTRIVSSYHPDGHARKYRLPDYKI